MCIFRNYYDVYASTLDREQGQQSERDEISEGDDQFNESMCDKSSTIITTTRQEEETCASGVPVEKWKNVTKFAHLEEDANSCYHSASASHTDNYCSTDEHELHHIPTQATLHSSDSGADISEQNYLNTTGGEQGSSFIRRKSRNLRETIVLEENIETHHERNNSLPDVFSTGSTETERAWEAFWARTGESLIWSSWIEKYSDYIDPTYLKQREQDKADTTACDDEVAQVNQAQAIDPEIVISVCSPNPPPPSDGWNPLSPTSDDPWTSHRINETENLLSPRCDSVTSSIPLTIGTTDSMTNVTRMTMDENYDFCSSKVSSESSNVSSTPSSDDSNSYQNIPLENRSESAAGLLEMDDQAMDVDQYWQVLWQQHFQEQYALHYKKYMEAEVRFTETQLSSSLKSDSGFARITRHRVHHHGATKNRIIKKRKGTRRIQNHENLSGLVSEMCLEADEAHDATEEKNQDKQSSNTKKENQETQNDKTGQFNCPELAAFGLPTSFGKSEKSKKDDDENPDPNENHRISMKRAHENDDDISQQERLKAGFELMGYAFDVKQPINIKGEINYKKKHIRLHNRMLKMKHQKPRHTYFDDDGNEVTSNTNEKLEAEPTTLIHSSSDDDSHTAIPPPTRLPLIAPTVANSNMSDPSSSIEVEAGMTNFTEGDDKPDLNASIDQENLSIEVEEVVGVFEEETTVDSMPTDIIENIESINSKKEKKKRRKAKFAAILPPEIINDKSLLKYWYKRFSLFSLFDQGIKLDKGTLNHFKKNLDLTHRIFLFYRELVFSIT